MAKERRSLNGKVVAITGGARGIGKATATALVRKGCRVAIGDLDLELAEQTAAGLGGGTIALPLDVTDRASFESFLDETERQLGPVDAVDQQRRDHAGDAVRRRERGLGPAPDRHQPARRHHRHPAGDRAAAARAAAATSSTSPRRRAKPAIPGIATYSGTKHAVVGTERGGARRAARQRRRGALRDADRRQHRADQRRRPALGQTGRGRGRRQRDRRRAWKCRASTSSSRAPTAC